MQHGLGFALVALQAALFGWLSQAYQFPAVIVSAAAVGTFTRLRIPLSREQAFVLSSAAAFFFLLKHRFSPQELPTGTEFIRTQVAFIIAQFLLAIEAAHFLIRREDDRLSPVLPALGAVALVCIADVQITEEQRTVTRVFAVSYPLLWALYLGAGRDPLPLPPPEEETRQRNRIQAAKRRRQTAGGILLAVAALAWVSSLGLYQLEKKIEGWLVQMMAGRRFASQAGFSRTSRLGSIAHRKSRQENDVALLVAGRRTPGSPGYLRGAVFTHLDSLEWRTPSTGRGTQMLAETEFPQGMRAPGEKEHLYTHPTIGEPSATDWRYWECWLEQDQESAAFTPMGTTHVITSADRMGALPFGVFFVYDAEASNPYTACVPNKPRDVAITAETRELCLFVPEECRPELEKLAEDVFADAATTQEKIEAAEAYFQQNYRYHLGVEIPPNENPLLYFLREKPPAHCEYFATAAAMLLRAEGIPCRYVTGLVPAEWNPSSGYWIARNRDAHAWVEAYDEQSKKWTIVEATPAEGVPSANRPAPRFAWWEGLQIDWRRLRVFLSQGRFGRAFSVLRTSWLAIPIGLLVAAFVFYLTRRLARRWRKTRTATDVLDPELLEMRKLLDRMDDQLQALGWNRHAGETLHQFAHRLNDWASRQRNLADDSLEKNPAGIEEAEHAADWYLDYAGCLYRGQWDGETRQRLLSRLPAR